MRITNLGFVLFAVVAFARVAAVQSPDTNAIDTLDGDDGSLHRQDNHDGWVNPEDLPAMPQCIAQQDPSAWLKAMTECTSKRCLSRFLFICTRHQWLTELSCLSASLSPTVVAAYLPYCSRSVLAKAQLFYWIRHVTGRTWLVDVGDAYGLDSLSPASLAKGYETTKTIERAPACLLSGSAQAPSVESFGSVMASCTFSKRTRYIYAAGEDPTVPLRPWEYSEHLHLMRALGFESVGYDLIGYRIWRNWGGFLFDKECFCSHFRLNDPHAEEPCSSSWQPIDQTMERLWLNAICGPTSLFAGWTDGLQLIGSTHVAVRDWRWPQCRDSMPPELTGPHLRMDDHPCVADACEPDERGFCRVRRAVDKACFCRDLSYDSCGGSCHAFGQRFDYVTWLHRLCGDVPGWHGLPKDWARLALPTRNDTIPWPWTMRGGEPDRADGTCSPARATMKEVVQFNSIAALSASALFMKNALAPEMPPWFLSSLRRLSCVLLSAALPVLVNAYIAHHFTAIPGYEDVPAGQLMLLWCTMPRLGWASFVWMLVRPWRGKNFVAAVASALLIEIILQAFASYYMLMTVRYGWDHGFYFGRLRTADFGPWVRLMYAGALLWLVAIVVLFAQLVRAGHIIHTLIQYNNTDRQRQRNSNERHDSPSIATNLLAQFHEYTQWLPWNLEEPTGTAPATNAPSYTAYGTMAVPVVRRVIRRPEKAFAQIYGLVFLATVLLWLGQGLFWVGLINYDLKDYCFPRTIKYVRFSWALATGLSVFFGLYCL